ncbi:hypothetical protein [Polluticoccus soli]|uniref:hypothetical protein n=1 Tax=Polluticoccus soli TaxID=3034150 RepID=UPI0023E1C9C3|nr:hypothetical protein [Flavipsychrobacter sp. JY13-12]
MLRVFIFSLLFLAAAPAFSRMPAKVTVPAGSIAPAIVVELRGDNLYLVGRGFRKTEDTGRGSGLKIDCGIATPAVKLSFIFADGSYYVYIPKETFLNTSFAVLLRGEVKLPDHRHGIGKLFGHSKQLHGDEALLQRLQIRELQSIRYEQEKMAYWDGKAIKVEYGPAQTYTNPTEFATMRSELMRLAP